MSGTKETAKKSTKKVASKRVSPTRRRVSGASKKHSATKKTKPSLQNTPKAERKKTSTTSEVSLPQNVSLRSISKASAIHTFDKNFSTTVSKITFVAGLCFALIGTTLASGVLIKDDISAWMVGQISGISSTTENQLVEEPVADIPDPTFDIITDIPDEITDSLSVTFKVTNAERIIIA